MQAVGVRQRGEDRRRPRLGSERPRPPGISETVTSHLPSCLPADTPIQDMSRPLWTMGSPVRANLRLTNRS